MSDVVKQPLFVYDEPFKVDKFNGGINNDPSNESIKDNQLRDAVNFHYNNGVPERRLGANIFKKIRYHDSNPDMHRNIVQGSFTFVGKYNPCYVTIRDGYIYYSVLSEVESMDMIEIPIDVDTTISNKDPHNLILGLEQHTPSTMPDPLLDHDGFILTETIDEDEDEDGTSGIYVPNQPRLVLQNYKTVQGVVNDDTLYIATGTRFIKVYEVIENNEVTMKAKIVPPYETNGWDYTNIGPNYFSPFPELLVDDTNELSVSRINFVKCKEHTVFVADGSTSSSGNFKAIMDYIRGTDQDDYYFKWEYKIGTYNAEGDYTWSPWRLSSEFTEGLNEHTINFSDIKADDLIKVRCSYANVFKDKSTWEIDYVSAEHGTFSVTYKVEAGTFDDYEPAPSNKFIDIHSCNKLFTDGNKVILYGSVNHSGNWYKSVIDNFAYITDKGGFNFQTSKNERIVACVPLEDNIIVFADNPHLGGSIHKVWGNGDDYDAGNGYFNPYKKRVVNTSHSCDHPNSVQFVNNKVYFKYRETIYEIDSRDLNSERLNVLAVSNNIGHKNGEVFIPEIPYSEDYEFKLFSEVTDEYYALIYPEQNLRWKMYYKNPIYNPGENKPSYPWLRDKTEALKIDSTFKINGISTHVTEDYLIQYTDDKYLDLGKEYEHSVKTKAYDLGLPAFGKFLNSLMMGFYRGSTVVSVIDVDVYNEAEYLLIGKRSTSFYDEETQTVIWGDPDTYYGRNIEEMDRPTLSDESVLDGSRLDKALYSSKTFNADLRFLCLGAYVHIRSSSPEAFALSSLIFDYTSTDLPSKSLTELYSQIIREVE